MTFKESEFGLTDAYNRYTSRSVGGNIEYQLGEEVGRGALGRVVVVTSPGGERFAGKILHPSNQADPRARSRFAGEAKIVSELHHPNVARVYGLVEIDDASVLLMELVDGPSLAALIARSAPLGQRQLLEFGRQLAAGLGAAHHLGLIHRDLKPDNVLIGHDDNGAEVVKIVDFGLARATSFAGVDDDAFAVVGTPDYMAPESIDPLAVDARSDLYALGCILFEMATAAVPFTGATAFAVVEAHRKQALDISTLKALLPPAWVDLISHLLAKQPSDRPQSAAQVCDAMAALQTRPDALAILGATTLSAGGQCAECNTPSVPGVSVCFGCGLSQVALAKGKSTVLIIGPGNTTDKLDAALRQKLVDWLSANPTLGISPGRLAKIVPRLPFVLAAKVSRTSGEALACSVESLGLKATVVNGGPLKYQPMRRKGWSLGGRFALIGVSGIIYGLHNIIGTMFLPIISIGGLGAIAGGFNSAMRPAAKQNKKIATGYPDSIAAPLSRVSLLVPTIEHARHRDSLRGVVQRALGVHQVAKSRRAGDINASLGKLIDVAVASIARVDAIDTELEASDHRNASKTERSLMLERDASAARLLGITAFLDSMRVRLVALGSRQDNDDVLGELQAHIEALEEIESL